MILEQDDDGDDDGDTIDSKASVGSRDPFLTPGVIRFGGRQPRAAKSALGRSLLVPSGPWAADPGTPGAAAAAGAGVVGGGVGVGEGVIGPEALDFEFGRELEQPRHHPQHLHHHPLASPVLAAGSSAPGGTVLDEALGPHRHHASEVVFQADVDKIIRLPRLIRKWSLRVVDHKWFNRFIFVVIILNSIVLGLDEPTLAEDSNQKHVVSLICT